MHRGESIRSVVVYVYRQGMSPEEVIQLIMQATQGGDAGAGGGGGMGPSDMAEMKAAAARIKPCR
jgi:hypothetical protein